MYHIVGGKRLKSNNNTGCGKKTWPGTLSVALVSSGSWAGPPLSAVFSCVPGPDRFGVLQFAVFLARTASVCYGLHGSMPGAPQW